MKEINGHKYSRESFEGYQFRAKVEMTTDGSSHTVDVYTTQTNKVIISGDLESVVSDKVLYFHVIHWATKEQDDMSAEWLDTFLDNF